MDITRPPTLLEQHALVARTQQQLPKELKAVFAPTPLGPMGVIVQYRNRHGFVTKWYIRQTPGDQWIACGPHTRPGRITLTEAIEQVKLAYRKDKQNPISRHDT